MQQTKKRIGIYPLVFAAIIFMFCLGCSSTSSKSTLFSDLKPIIINLSNQGKWREAHELLQINLTEDLARRDQIQLHLLLAENFRYLEKYGNAEESFHKTIHYSRLYDIPDHLGDAFYGLGDLSYLNWSYFKREDALAQSRAYLDTAMTHATEKRNDVLTSKVLYRQGTIFQIEGAEEESKKCFQKGLDISFSSRDTVGIIRNHTHTAVVFRRSGAMDSALFHHGRAYEFAKAINRNYSEAHALGNLGSYYLELGDVSMAEEYYVKANFLSEELQHGIVLCKSLYGLAVVREKQERKSEAMDFAEVGSMMAKEKGYLNFQRAFDTLIERLKAG